MFSLVYRLSRWFLARPVHIQSGGLVPLLNSLSDYTLITSKSPLRGLQDQLGAKLSQIPTIIDPPTEIDAIDALIPQIKTTWVVGLGGGRVTDVAKYLGYRTKRKVCVIPTVLSTTSWLNMGIAYRKNNRVYVQGVRQPHRILIDPALIVRSPPLLNLAGIADLLCACSACGDWLLDAKHNHIKTSTKGLAAFKSFIDSVVQNPQRLYPFTESSVVYLYDQFLHALALCGASFSDRPLEGSEHVLFYLLEELHGTPFIHGQIIAFTTLLALYLQQSDAFYSWESLQRFYRQIHLPYGFSDLQLNESIIFTALKTRQNWLAQTHHHPSILNYSPALETEKGIAELIAWVKKL